MYCEKCRNTGKVVKSRGGEYVDIRCSCVLGESAVIVPPIQAKPGDVFWPKREAKKNAQD